MPPAAVTAVDDAFVVDREGVTVLQVLVNDDFGSAQIDHSTLEIIGVAHDGVLEIVGSNLKYTLDDGVTSGSEAFSYRVCAVDGGCDTAAVTLTIAVE
ncbi:MAG: hypothetical protein DHS20C19_09390 [Acidimicrobiales bacterium]|nr:MAG: hypothetical protein DHS20C19_09390 [Acidimicrobiales bacterium]